MKRAATKEWPGQATQQQRKDARRNIILEEVGITAATLERYYAAVARLAPHLAEVDSEGGLDETVALWIQGEFEDGTHYIWWGTHCRASTILSRSLERSCRKVGAFTEFGGNMKSHAEHHQ